ncbi:ARM repeat-containing protein [Cristinia sonorae]|uniref:ARM repeat-containing protein n=1 Tax=Cristinia sonorae TaxID=1940300 RepID=A0A8K0UFE1_9AGAR|nr:ARM repeat-containing protein [Cristinia sonorae]
MPTESVELEVEIDQTNLGGENGEIYVFQWLSHNYRMLQQASSEDLKVSQEKLIATLIALVTSPAPYPIPGRPIRNLVAQSLIAIYSQGETKSMYDTIQALIKVAGDQKSTVLQDAHRIATIYCSGELMRVFGAQVMSLVSDIATLSLKLYKSANSILLRCQGIMALKHTIYSAKRALTDALAKDITKQMRQALGDKALPVVRAATRVLILMFPSGDPTRTAVEIESLVSLCVKHLENADYPTRLALAKLAGHLLASSRVERVVTAPESSKKKKSDEKEDEDMVSAAAHAAAEDLKPIMTPTEMLLQLSNHFNKPQTSPRVRIGLFSFYLALISTLGTRFVEQNYGLIVEHFMSEIISNPRNNTSRHDILVARTLVGTILRDLVGIRMLGEQAQIFAVQELSNAYLKRWPAMLPGQTAPTSLVLTIALREVAGLLRQLGNAPPLVQEALMDPLLTLLTHTSHTVRVHASWALRCFCYSTPLRLPKALLSLVESLQHDTAQLVNPAAPSDIHLRALGHAYGLTGLLALIPHRPLYISYDMTANVFYTAVQLLKRAGDHDVHVAKVEVEIAWTTVAALMTLGPNFVRAHLPQLLVLWRNALPKPTTKDSTPGRNPAEWQFLLHVRESALRAVYHFLQHNGSLVTTDISRRISSLLSNALQFSTIFLSQRMEETTEPGAPVKSQGLTLSGTESLLRCRIFQCFSRLDLSTITESTQTALLQATVSLFASADGYSGSSVQAAIASSSGTFTNIWQTVDGYAYGVTDVKVDEEALGSASQDWLNRDSNEAVVDDLLRQPIIRSIEHDPLSLCEVHLDSPGHLRSEAPSPATAAVNAAIELFARLLPVQDSSSSLKAVTKLLEATESVKLERNTGRKAAVLMNSTIALALTFKYAQSHGRQGAEVFGNVQVSTPLASFLKGVLVDSDILLRRAASEAVGRLASLAGTTFLTNQIKTLVNEVVSNRDPHGRAGCALAFGAIYGYVGSLAAGPLLKTTVHVLMSLITDPHPVVHYWALKSLGRVIDAANLAYASYVPSTLGLLFRVYMMESHEPEGGSLNYVNMSGGLPAYQAICQTIDAIVTVVGPDIHESTRTRTLILDLINQFLGDDESDDGVCIEAIKCIQHALMFAPEQVEIPKLITRFRGYLSSSRRPLKVASINGLYQLVQKDALLMSRLGGDQLVEQLFGMLDYDSSVEGVRSVIMTWLQHTVVHNPSAWIDLCQRIMARTTASQRITDATSKRKDFVDDEGQSLSVDSGGDADTDASGDRRPIARWRTQLFALQCLHSTCTIVSQSGRREHIDLVFARERGLPASALLVSRVADLIKIAFTASAAQVMEIRLEGLTVLKDVISIFAAAPDPDYENASLLEQYQAPIAAALTPAFSADSTPEILASAIEASAIFVGSGVVKDVNRMGRILKLLVSALEQCQDIGMLHLGDAAELSPNASVMLRIATLSAWAQLKVASNTKDFLADVVRPHIQHLSPLWITVLRDYSGARAEVTDDGSGSGGLDISYSTLGREILLPYYAASSSNILNAVTVAMEEKNEWIQAAMNGKESLEESTNVSLQPAPFFHMLFGLVYEALVNSKPEPRTPRNEDTIIALRAMKCLVQPAFAGDVFSDPAIFEELVHLLYRLALTETPAVQIHLLEAIISLAKSLQAAAKASGPTQATESSSTSTIHCLKIIAYVLRKVLPSGSEPGTFTEVASSEKIAAINTGFVAFCEVMKHCNSSQQGHFRILGIFLYHELLRDESTSVDMIGPTLQSLKLLLEISSPAEDAGYESLIHSLLSACLSNIDNMRGRAGAVCSRKISSNLLAISLIMTVIPSSVRLGQAVVDHSCFLICQNIMTVNEDISITAAQCGRTLVVAALSGNAALRRCLRFLLTAIVDCIASIATAENGSSRAQHHALIVAEIWRTLAHLFTHTHAAQRTFVLAFVLPTMILLLTTSLADVQSATVTQIMSFAAADPEVFKTVVGQLQPDMKKNMEDCLKQALGNHRGNIDSSSKPQISLRSFK